MKAREFFKSLWRKAVFRHIVSGAIAVFISTTAINHGVDQTTAQQAGNAVGEVVNTIPAD